MLDVVVVTVVVVEDSRELEAEGGRGAAELLALRESRIGVSTPEPS